MAEPIYRLIHGLVFFSLLYSCMYYCIVKPDFSIFMTVTVTVVIILGG